MITLDWTDAAAALPDDDTLVLVALDDTEVWPGWRDGDIWRHFDAVPITDARVTHWMHLPAAPGVTVCSATSSLIINDNFAGSCGT